MAKETISEFLVRKACKKYMLDGKAIIKKNDPYIRLVGQEKIKQLIYSGSSGLDFSGVLKGGKYITFEVKETENNALPINNIGTSQIDMIEKSEKIGAEAFLLIYFKSNNKWYRLDHEFLKKIITDNDCRYASIPEQYCMAYGMLVPNDDGTPDFLQPETHPSSKNLKKTYPSWMAGHERREKREVQQIGPYLNEEDRRKKISKAILEGIKNAGVRERKVELYKKGYSNGPEG